jgi:hypothetical protein
LLLLFSSSILCIISLKAIPHLPKSTPAFSSSLKCLSLVSSYFFSNSSFLFSISAFLASILGCVCSNAFIFASFTSDLLFTGSCSICLKVEYQNVHH